jgi:drug/metabolite transporter (DMT)-like permease
MRSSTNARVWIALVTVYVVWGSTYFAIKIAVRTLPPVLAAGTRFLAAGVLLGAVLLVAGRSLRATRRQVVAAAGLGIVLLGCGVGLVHVAEQHIDSSVAAMIAGSVPLQVVVWRTLSGERVRRATVVAAIVGLLGLALVVAPDGLRGGGTAVGLLTMLVGTIAWSRGSFASSRLDLPADPFVTTVIEMLAGGTALLVAGTALGQWGDLARADLEAGPVAAWVYLVTFGSIVAFTAYAWLLQHAPISRVVTHQYVNPLVAVALGAAFLGERPGATTLVGAVVIVGAVAATLRSEGGSRIAVVGDLPDGTIPAEQP